MTRYNVKIAAGQSVSGGQDLQRQTLVGIYVPSGWTSASLTLQASPDGTNWSDIKTFAGDEYEIVAGTGACYVPLVQIELQGVAWIRVRSGTAAVPVNQVAERDITLVARVVPN